MGNLTIAALKLGVAEMQLDEIGRIIALGTERGASLLADHASEPLIQIGLNGKIYAPTQLEMESGNLCFHFSVGTKIVLSYKEKNGYLVICVDEVMGEADQLIVGPIPTRLCEVIGDVIGVVQGDGMALGIQALNIKTLAGFPIEYREQIPSYVDESRCLSELSVETFRYFESTAFPCCDGKGSVLQLYCENRERSRTKHIMGFDNVTVPPMAPEKNGDEKIEGAAFVLFCCEAEQAMDLIGRIELGEGLPHPLIDGEWAKTSRAAMKSYLIADFDPDNLDNLLNYTEAGGFEKLYHPGLFHDWGHFSLRSESFPNGDDSLRDCCKRARKRGIGLGLHTLTSFTTTNDSYVTPVPDPHLAKLDSAFLAADIGANTLHIPVTAEEPFLRTTNLQTIQIGEELISYREAAGGMLIDCTRGAFNTIPAAHPQGEMVFLLMDHAYRVFFPDITLQDKFVDRLTALFKDTNLDLVSFDGLEGCAATGEDSYAINRFCSRFQNGWKKDGIINDASRLNHFLWHMHTRMNWGEPWGEKMREGMLDYRIKNQDFYRRNLFPRMLGWFLIRKADRKFEATTPVDIEWALSMAAGFDSGFAFSASEDVLNTVGCSGDILKAVKNWETLRIAGRFTEELRVQLRDPATEWHLTENEGVYCLYPMQISKPMVCDLLEMQPGQPGGSDWVYDNLFDGQEYEFQMRVIGNGCILNPSLITSQGMIRFDCSIQGGQYLLYRDGKAVITDRNYRPLTEVSYSGKSFVQKGQQAFSFACGFDGEEGPEVTVKVYTYGKHSIL